MTVAQLAPPKPAPTLASALGAVRARGMRVSTTRRMILKALFAAERPVTAETLAGRLARGDLASVYRNLERLEAIGLVRHVHIGHGPGRYALATPDDREFVSCERCGEFEAVDPARLDAVRDLIRTELGYRARFTHFPIVGLCSACGGHA